MPPGSFWNLILSCKLFNHPFQAACYFQIQLTFPLVFIPVTNKRCWAEQEDKKSASCFLSLWFIPSHLWPLLVSWLTPPILHIGSNLSIPWLFYFCKFIPGVPKEFLFLSFLQIYSWCTKPCQVTPIYRSSIWKSSSLHKNNLAIHIHTWEHIWPRRHFSPFSPLSSLNSSQTWNTEAAQTAKENPSWDIFFCCWFFFPQSLSLVVNYHMSDTMLRTSHVLSTPHCSAVK